MIIPVKDGGAAFRRCLASLHAATVAPLELIVVADGDTSGSFRDAQAFGARILELPETGGPARARNRGAQLSRGEVLLFLDADVAVHKDTLARVRDCFAADGDLTALFGSYDDRPAAPNFLSQYRNLLHHFVHQTGRDEASTFWSGCGAIRRDVFLAMGGFDETYRRPSIEDIELGYRLARAGHRVRLEKSVQATHLKEWRAASILRTDFAQRAVPWTELILRDGRFINDLNLRHGSRASVGLAFVALLALLISPWQPWGLVAALSCLGALLLLNRSLLSFFLRKRGVLFTAAVIPWLVIYQLYSGLGFIVGVMRHLARVRRTAEAGR